MKATKLMMAAALAVGSIAATTMTGCGTAPPTQAEAVAQVSAAKSALMLMKSHDPSLDGSLQGAYGYVVFPSVGKGGVVLAAGGGGGEIYQGGKYWGTAQLTMGTGGLSLGAESYAELIVFQNKTSFDAFTNNQTQFDAQATAVAVRANASTALKYDKGIAILIDNTKGLMVDASIGAQQFTVKPGAMPTTAPGAM